MTTKTWYFTAIAFLAVSIITTAIQGSYGPVRAILHVTAAAALVVATRNKAWKK